MSQTATISIIIPAYNAQGHIASCLDSVLAQTYTVHEIIIVDDGSQDNTAEIVKKYSGVIYYHQNNQGQASARNHGINKATGDYLAFLDSDDWWQENKLEKQIVYLQKNTTVHGAFTLLQNIEQRPNQADKVSTPKKGYLPSTFMIRRKDFLSVGLLDTQWTVGEFIHWYDLAQSKGLQFHVIDEVLAFRRIHGNNIGQQKKSAQGDYLKILKASLDRRRANNA